MTAVVSKLGPLCYVYWVISRGSAYAMVTVGAGTVSSHLGKTCKCLSVGSHY